MGSSHGVYRSKPSDSIHNLQWSLEETLSWEEQAPQVKSLLVENTTDPIRSNMTGLDRIHHEMEEARRIMFESNRYLLSESGGKRKRSQKYLNKLTKEKILHTFK